MAVNLADLSLPQLEGLKTQLDQVIEFNSVINDQELIPCYRGGYNLDVEIWGVTVLLG